MGIVEQVLPFSRLILDLIILINCSEDSNTVILLLQGQRMRTRHSIISITLTTKSACLQMPIFRRDQLPLRRRYGDFQRTVFLF